MIVCLKTHINEIRFSKLVRIKRKKHHQNKSKQNKSKNKHTHTHTHTLTHKLKGLDQVYSFLQFRSMKFTASFSCP